MPVNITRLNTRVYAAVIISVIVLLALQIFLIRNTEDVLIPFVFLLAAAGVLLLTTVMNDFSQFLLFLSVVTFAYADSAFNYYLNYIVIQDLPVIFLGVLAVISWFSQSGSLKIGTGYFGKPLLMMFIAAFLLMIFGIVRGNNSYFSVYEFVHFIYLLLAFPISFMIRDPKKYNTIFNTLLSAAVVITFQYILFGILYYTDTRYTTFHASMYPVFIALLVSKFIFLEGEVLKRIGIVALIIFYAAGAYGTLTRSVWISMVIALVATVGFYYYDNNRERLKKYSNFLIMISAVATVMFLYSFVVTSVETAQKEGLDYATNRSERLESLSAPSSDASFLMRVEIAYYLYEKFIASPLIGEGLGSSVTYKIFGDSELYYPDSVWFYYLWKGGILYFALAVWLYTRLFKSAIKIYRASEDLTVRIYMLAIVGGFTAMMFYGLFAPQLIKYSKLNLVFAILYAFVISEEKKLDA